VGLCRLMGGVVVVPSFVNNTHKSREYFSAHLEADGFCLLGLFRFNFISQLRSSEAD
jgi:hypothetical protein